MKIPEMSGFLEHNKNARKIGVEGVWSTRDHNIDNLALDLWLVAWIVLLTKLLG